MEIVRSLAPGIAQRPAVLTMGKFDGLHLGHRQLIGTAVRRARELGFVSAALTWDPHPNLVLRPDSPPQLLTSLEEKIDLIAALGPDLLIVAPFTEATKTTSAAAYMAQICAALPLRELWVGEDFAMGRGRSGDVPSLMTIGRDLGFAVGAVSKVMLGGEPVSSSRVRGLLAAGDVEGAAAMLGRPFGLRGTVVPGDQRGRLIGFPTANLQIRPEHVLPADGVYACRIALDGASLPAVTNVGVRPTFDGLRRTVEAHLLDWGGDLYGRALQVTFLHRLRGEQRFSGVDALVAQIRRDADAARELLGAV
ncbi:bifunctional riboflavin kinase/FAD synthetase [Oscillochloris sp. ZM17-4]|uniref:bifunctional riboflavin kinase/FAD synthetase n=1 Tax=Oscillochloris sp. ZM17-4 TaxID=2866714 RepID=UPI001C73712D|nr:bifunctional riboflavin kinase/FAD synthetase [Oscillochloris sp. ZM17-4]